MGLSASLVEKTKPKAIDQWLSDGDGLYLVVTPKGSKIWKLKYSKPYSKKRTNITIGTYPAYSLKEARDLCAEYQVLLARNIDPQEHIKQHTQQEIQRRETTFSIVAEQWKASKTNIKPSTLEKYWRIVELYLLPQLGSLPITDITPRIVKPVLDIPYQQGKAEMFRKSIKLLNAILNYAVNSLFSLDANPCLKITTAFESLGRGTNPNIHFDDLPEFLNDLLNSNVDLLTRYLVLWQLLTMTRPTEAAETQWHEIDEQKALWTIPPERMKNKAEHRIFLSTQALRLLQKIKQFKIDTNPYLFVSYRAKTGHLNGQTAGKAIRDIAQGKYKNSQTAHGLRKIASSYLHEQGILPDVVELCLSHTIQGLRGVYMTSKYDKHRKTALQKWGDYIEHCSKGWL